MERLNRTNSWTTSFSCFSTSSADYQPKSFPLPLASWFFLPSPYWETRAIMLRDFHASMHTRKIRPSRSKRQSRPWQNGTVALFKGESPDCWHHWLYQRHWLSLTLPYFNQSSKKNSKTHLKHVKYFCHCGYANMLPYWHMGQACYHCHPFCFCQLVFPSSV